jgi:glycerol-3-phosphate dehydrogenase
MHMEKWIVFSLAAMLSVPLVAVKAAALDTDLTEPATGLEQSSRFSIVVNATGPGISASCEHGCA